MGATLDLSRVEDILPLGCQLNTVAVHGFELERITVFCAMRYDPYRLVLCRRSTQGGYLTPVSCAVS